MTLFSFNAFNSIYSLQYLVPKTLRVKETPRGVVKDKTRTIVNGPGAKLSVTFVQPCILVFNRSKKASFFKTFSAGFSIQP